ncbi:MAG TPA: hypothetical protein VHE55_16480 [Fimbriimonadaceae bacterium]|nr:hypothetical protein [Fimbriimonadaceae bacterium]
MITVVINCPGVSSLQYEEACRLANVSPSNPPAGLVFHCGSPTEDGWLVVDVWESEEAFKKFGERLMPAVKEAGIDAHPMIYRTHQVMGSAIPVTA